MASVDPVPETELGQKRKTPPVVTDRDILFNCPNCRGELVVDRDGEGLEVPCSHCGKPLVVPAFQPRAVAAPVEIAPPAPAPAVVPSSSVAVAPAITRLDPAPPPPVVTRSFDHSGLAPEQLNRRSDELKHQLKENRSQDTEMRGHVNRATMELHRLQLRLKKLQERQVDIQAELESIQTHLGSDAA